MKTGNRHWIVYLLLFSIMQISASHPKNKVLFHDNDFLAESILQVLPVDLPFENGLKILASGKNYSSRELFIFCLDFSKRLKPIVIWKSDNLFEDRGVMGMAFGKFNGAEEQLLAVTRQKYYFFSWGENTFRLTSQVPHTSETLAVAAGDVDGDGTSELISAHVGKITGQSYDCIIRISKWKDRGIQKVYESGFLGNIRALASGDMDDDGKNEILVEEGVRLDTGAIRIFDYGDCQLKERLQDKLSGNGAIYGLKVRNFGEGKRVMTASVQGKVNLLRIDHNHLLRTVPESVMKCGLVDGDASDVNHDGEPELILVGYPHKLIILGK